jgi:hypothetical protein
MYFGVFYTCRYIALCGYIGIWMRVHFWCIVAGPLLLPRTGPLGWSFGFIVNVAIVFSHVGYHRIAGRGVRCPSLDIVFI